MKFKRMASITLAFSMVTALAAVKTDAAVTGDLFERTEKALISGGWALKENGMYSSGTYPEGYNTSFMELTDKYQDGESKYALHVNCDMSYKGGNYFYIDSLKKYTLPAGKYTIKYKMLGTLTENTWDSTFKFVMNSSSYGNTNVQSTSGKNGWNEYKCTMNLASDVTNATFRLITGSNNEYIIDDIRLFKSDDETETNLLEDGDFEGTETADTLLEFSDAWTQSFVHANQAIEDVPGYETSEMKITDKFQRPGSNYCLYVKNDMPYANTRYFMLSSNHETSLDAGVYYLEYWMRGAINTITNWDTAIWIASGAGSSVNSATLIETGENGWNKYRIKYTVSEATSPYAVWIHTGSRNKYLMDDITLYKEGDENKTNLITDGDFEKSVNPIGNIGEFSDSWRVWTNGQDSSVEGYNTSFMELTGTNQDAGSKYAVQVKCDMPYASGRFFCLENTHKYNVPAGTYTIKYKMLGTLTKNTWDSTFKFIMNGKSYGNTNAQSTSGKTGWNEYTCTMKLDTDMTDATFQFITGSENEYIIDDIRVYRADDETKTNIIIDGDFEDSVAVTQFDEIIRHPMAIPANDGKINIAWVNPNNRFIKSVKIYNGSSLVEGFEAKTTAYAFNDILLDDIESFKNNDVKILIEYIYGTTSEAVVNLSEVYDYSELEYKINGNWTTWGSQVVYGEQYGITFFHEPTKLEKADGEYSYHIAFPEATTPGLWMDVLDQKLDFPAGTYTVNYKLKAGRPIKETTDITLGITDAAQWNIKKSKNPESIGNGWYQYSVTGSISGKSSELHIKSTSHVNVYIDDIEIYNDKNQLVYEQSFEDVKSFSPKQDISCLTASNMGTDGDDSIKISWTNPESYYIQQLDLYVGETRVGTEEISYAKDEMNNITVTGLVPGTEYDIKLLTTVKGVSKEYHLKATPGNDDFIYSMAVVGDNSSLMNDTPWKVYNTYNYLKNNSENVKFVFNLGSITGNSTAKEWATAKANIQSVDYTIPYSVVRGEKDGKEDFKNYFAYHTDEMTGSYDGTALNTYKIFYAGNTKYMALNIDYDYDENVIAWAEEVIAENPDCNVIISISEDKNDNLKNNVIGKYENIVLVLSDNKDGEGITASEITGINGHMVTELLVSDTGEENLIAMLYFAEDGKTVYAIYYSALEGIYCGGTEKFVLDIKENTLTKPYAIKIDGIEAKIDGENASGRIIAGLYDGNGKLIAVKSCDASGASKIAFDLDMGGDYIKLITIQ